MYCSNCGAMLKEGGRFCGACGHPIQRNPQLTASDTHQAPVAQGSTLPSAVAAHAAQQSISAAQQPVVPVAPTPTFTPAPPIPVISQAPGADRVVYPLSQQSLDADQPNFPPPHDSSEAFDAEAARTKAGISLVCGVAVFIICSIIQGAGGSSMFELLYYEPPDKFLSFLMAVTFWPGWIITGLLVVNGIRLFLQSGSKASGE